MPAVAMAKSSWFDDLDVLLSGNFEHLSRGELRRLADVAERRARLFENHDWGKLQGEDKLWPAAMSSQWKTLAATLRTRASLTEAKK